LKQNTFEDTKGQSEAVNRRRRHYNGKKKRDRTMFWKKLHRKLQIEQHEPHKKLGWTQVLLVGGSKQFVLPLVMLVLSNMNIMW